MDDNMTAHALTRQVIERLDQCPDPRLRELVGGVIRHVHEFAVEQALTEAGIPFVKAGVFKSWVIRPWNPIFVNKALLPD